MFDYKTIQELDIVGFINRYLRRLFILIIVLVFPVTLAILATENIYLFACILLAFVSQAGVILLSKISGSQKHLTTRLSDLTGLTDPPSNKDEILERINLIKKEIEAEDLSGEHPENSWKFKKKKEMLENLSLLEKFVQTQKPSRTATVLKLISWIINPQLSPIKKRRGLTDKKNSTDL